MIFCNLPIPKGEISMINGKPPNAPSGPVKPPITEHEQPITSPVKPPVPVEQLS
jgi:hypothetical protein